MRSDRKRSFGKSEYNRKPRKVYRVTCPDCGKECEVSFKPMEGVPVYCRDCYQRRKYRCFF